MNYVLHAGTFNPVTWGASVLLAILANTAIEGLVLRSLFKIPISSRRIWVLAAANSVSVFLAFGSLFIVPLEL